MDARAVEYLKSRGITDARVLELSRARYQGGRVWLPWLDADGQEVYSTGRAVNGQEPKYLHVRGERPPLFAAGPAWDADPVILVEGHFDALAAAQIGIPAFATTMSSLSDSAVPILAARHVVYAIPDNDEAGEKWLRSVTEKLGGRVDLRVGRVPGPHKDLADVAAEGGEEAVAGVVLDAQPVVGGDPPARLGQQAAIDVALVSEQEDGWREPTVIEGLLGPGETIAVTGEEGDGKTMLGDQLCRQLQRGEDIFGCFPVGELRPRAVLFVDTHQERPEIDRRARDMRSRGLAVEPEQFFWLPAIGLDPLGSEEDRTYLEAEITRCGADFLWIDAGSHLVAEAKDDTDVRAFFDYLSDLMGRAGLLAVGLTLFPRKRPAGEYGRRFDDLFGSREWKARLSVALYIEGERATCWKDRAGRVGRLWPRSRNGRYAQARLERPGLTDPQTVPFRIVPEELVPEVDEAEIEARVLARVEAQPGHFTKSSLAVSLGGRKEDALAAVTRLLSAERIGPDKARARLHVLDEGSGEETLL